MSGAMSLRFTTQTQIDIRRMTRELTDLQGQVASGLKANDLAGFAGSSSRLLSAQGMKAAVEARASTLNQLDARLDVQGDALGQVTVVIGRLSQSIRDAIAADDGRGINMELEMGFTQIVSALNEKWNGEPLFAGERKEGEPVVIQSLGALTAATIPDDVFDEALRQQTIDLGFGLPTTLSAKASELGSDLFGTLRDLKLLLDNSGGSIGQPINDSQRTQLLNILTQLESGARTFTNEESRVGQLQARFGEERMRLQERSDLLTKEVGDQVDADLAEVSIRLNALMMQYQAAAKTFSDLSKLSLLNYL